MNPPSEPGHHPPETPPQTTPAPRQEIRIDTRGTGLSSRDLVLLNLATVAALNRTDELAGHIEHVLAHGVTPQEILDVLDQVAQLAGHPHLRQQIILGDALREIG